MVRIGVGSLGDEVFAHFSCHAKDTMEYNTMNTAAAGLALIEKEEGKQRHQRKRKEARLLGQQSVMLIKYVVFSYSSNKYRIYGMYAFLL